MASDLTSEAQVESGVRHERQKLREASDNWLECVQPASYMETKMVTNMIECHLTPIAYSWSVSYCHLTCGAKVKGGV